MSLFFACFVLHVWNGEQLFIPFYYEGDPLFYLMTIKSVVTTGWYWTNPLIGAPGVHTLADFPTPEAANYLIIKFLSLFSDNPIFINNVFYLLTFPLSALTAFLVLKRWGLLSPFAATGALLFSLLPYHFMRFIVHGHLFLAAYYVIPLLTYLAIFIYENQPIVLGKKRWFYWSGYLLCAILGGSAGIYYAFFGSFFLLVAGICASLERQKIRPLCHALLFIGVISATVVVNLLPTITHVIENGKNNNVAHRSMSESEVNGLKITQLLLPMDQSRIEMFSNLKSKYNTSGVFLNENMTVTLGTVAGIGFLILLFRFFVHREGVSAYHVKMGGLARLTLAGLFFGTIGGFSSLFALLVSTKIRAPNRISIYLGFFALAAFFFLLQELLKKVKSRTIVISCAIVSLFLGVYTQTSRDFDLSKRLSKTQKEYEEDQIFFSKIDQFLPEKSMIFQIPYIPFPEYGNSDYFHFKAHMHAPHQRWSFGTMKGRLVDQWQKKTSHLPVEQLLRELINTGFSGILVDRTVYEEPGKVLEQELYPLLGAPIIVEDKRSFWDLRSYREATSSTLR